MCGIVGIVLESPPSSRATAVSIYYALYALQHRGQESAGMALSHEGQIKLHKRMGLVPEVFNDDVLKSLEGKIGIGHVRYSTTGGSRIENAQPFSINYKEGAIAIAHNGNLVNSAFLREQLQKEGRMFLSDSDTEVIAHLLVKELMKSDLIGAIKELMRMLVGSYSLTILTDGKMVAVRGPLGIKPLCLGKLDGGYIVASESVAVDTLGGRFVRDVKPGEVLIFDGNGMKSHRIYRPTNTAHCVFEYIYFARPDSILDGMLVYDARRQVGATLAEEYAVKADIISPVPDSGITLAIGYARRSGIQYSETLMKNRYIGRTFIMPGQNMRDVSVKLKLNVIAPNVKDRKIVIVDDSIVRGTTSRRIIDSLRAKGAKEVHVRIGSPPIMSPCYLGIDMKTRDELIASHNTVEDTRKSINADSLGYVSIAGLTKSIGLSEKNLCVGCLTGVYPVEIPGENCVVRQLKLTQF
jgi:amidophosphoribosyltransferase